MVFSELISRSRAGRHAAIAGFSSGIIACLVPLVLLSGCYTATDREPLDLQVLPEAFSVSRLSRPSTQTVAPEAVWWNTFNRSDLDALESAAFTDNLDIDQAWARLRQSEAAALQAGVDLYPDVSLTSGYDRSWRNEGITASNNYEVGASISYDLDLWGKIRSTKRVAQARALASADDLQSTALTIAASVANRWIEIIEAEHRVALLHQQLAINSTQLELIELRFRNSQANSLDVYQQRQSVARTRSNIPRAEADRAASHYALNLLLGRAATEPLAIDWQSRPTLPPMPRTGVPSDLLEQRPDVRAALRRIEAADWNMAAAQADRLPSVALGLSGSTGSDRFEDLFDDWLGKWTLRIVAPIVDGGRRQLEVEKQLAVVDEAVAKYRQTVLIAFEEVEYALMLEQKVRQQLEALRAELELSRQTLSAARNRYANGLSDYLNVTSSLVSVQNLERDEITQVANLFKARIALHQALGGQLPSFQL